MSLPSQSEPKPRPRPIIVLGAGIIGLTTAIRLLESSLCKEAAGGGHEVHILADHLPNDPLDPRYASTIAGAHHLSFAEDDDLRQVNWDKETFRVMYDEWKAEGEEQTGLMGIKQTEYYVGTKNHLKIYESHPDFKVNDVTNLPDIDHSVSFTTLTMTPLTYLNRLLTRISQLSKAGSSCQIHRIHLSSLSDLSAPPIIALIGNIPPLAVMICVGLGAQTLGGVNDHSVYPTRGQVVKIKAPWIKNGYTKQVSGQGHGGERTYLIPRCNGEVVCGGTREENDWYPYPRTETKKDILKRVRELYPGILPPHQSSLSSIKNKDESTSNKDEDEDDGMEGHVIDHLVGFRPSRKQGIRLEPGPDIYLGSGSTNKDGPATKVVYNYGHGGAGWQSCWGTASDAIKVLEGIL